MRYGRYRFCHIILNEGSLPGFTGSALRGAFGHALRATVCAVTDGECNSCMVQGNCLYANVFELSTHKSGESKQLVAAPPHPYIIEPPAPTEKPYAPGDAFAFELLLFGDSNDHLPYFIYAIERMGRTGIRTSDNIVRMALSEVETGGETIYRKVDNSLTPGDWSHLLPLHLPEETAAGVLTLRLETPLRLKVDGRYTDRLPFPTLVRALLRRATILAKTYGTGSLPFDHRVLLNMANETKIVEEDLRWEDFSRTSSRQQKKMSLGGIVGDISYRGQIAAFLSLLDFCKEAHIGKQTTFGLGKFNFTWKEDSA